MSTETGRAKAVAVAVVFTLAAHSLLLFCDYQVWDGIIYDRCFEGQVGISSMWRLFQEAGRPLDMLIYAFLHQIGPSGIVGKFVGLIAWASIIGLITSSLCRLQAMPLPIAAAIGCVSGTLPVFGMLGDFTFAMHCVCVLLFWMGILFFSRSATSYGMKAVGARLLSLSCLFVSFNLSSLLMFFYACLVAAVILRRPSNLSFSYLSRLSLRHADFLLLPILFWIIKTSFTPTSGYYASYNQPSLSASVLTAALQATWSDFLLSHMQGAAGVMVATGLVVACGTLIFKKIFPSGYAKAAVCTIDARLGGRVMLAGAILLAGAVIPYFAVGQAITVDGWTSRNAILTPLPVSMLMVGIIIIISTTVFRSMRPAWLLGVLVVALTGSLLTSTNYLVLQGLGAKQVSLERKLKSSLAELRPTVVQLRDYFTIPRSIAYYPPLVWTCLAVEKGQDIKTFIFDIAQQLPYQTKLDEQGQPQILFPHVPMTSQLLVQMLEQTTMPYMLQSIPRTGPQIMLVVQPGKYGSAGMVLGARYLWVKWFNPDGLPEFLDQVTETHVLELPPVAST